MLLKQFFGHEKPVLPFKTLPWVDKITNLASYPVVVCKLVCWAEQEPLFSYTGIWTESLSTCADLFSKTLMDSTGFKR